MNDVGRIVEYISSMVSTKEFKEKTRDVVIPVEKLEPFFQPSVSYTDSRDKWRNTIKKARDILEERYGILTDYDKGAIIIAVSQASKIKMGYNTLKSLINSVIQVEKHQSRINETKLREVAHIAYRKTSKAVIKQEDAIIESLQNYVKQGVNIYPEVAKLVDAGIITCTIQIERVRTK